MKESSLDSALIDETRLGGIETLGIGIFGYLAISELVQLIFSFTFLIPYATGLPSHHLIDYFFKTCLFVYLISLLIKRVQVNQTNLLQNLLIAAIFLMIASAAVNTLILYGFSNQLMNMDGKTLKIGPKLSMFLGKFITIAKYLAIMWLIKKNI